VLALKLEGCADHQSQGRITIPDLVFLNSESISAVH
jgi:hypothetical protein